MTVTGKFPVRIEALLYVFSSCERHSKPAEMYILYKKYKKKYQREILCVVDVSINWAADRNWQTKLQDTWRITQMNLPRQERVKPIRLVSTSNDRLRVVETPYDLLRLCCVHCHRETKYMMT